METTVDFLVIGGQRCGTTSFFHYLRQHPQIYMFEGKEIHYFDRHYQNGQDWYETHFNFQVAPAGLIGEVSPNYMIYPYCPERVRDYNPDIKLIALLRNPIDRAYSHFMGKRITGREPCESFQKSLTLENDRISSDIKRMKVDQFYYSQSVRNFSYMHRGHYYMHLKKWLSFFSRENFLILKSEELFCNPAVQMDLVADFLNISKFPKIDTTPKGIGRYSHGVYPPLEKDIVEFLSRKFCEDQKKLNDLLGTNIKWF